MLFFKEELYASDLAGSIVFISLFGTIVVSVDMVFIVVTTNKRYGLMVNNVFYYCGKNIMDGAKKIKERNIKKSYREYATGDKESLYINKTTNHDLYFGIIDTNGGDKIVIFYYIQMEYDHIESDERLNIVNIQKKYNDGMPDEEYKIVKLDNGKFTIERFYSISNYFEDKIYYLTAEREFIKDKLFSNNYADEYESEAEAKSIIQEYKKHNYF